MSAYTEFCLLGPLVVRRGGDVVPIQPGKQRILLAMLLLNANLAVPLDDLAEALWDARAPMSARVTVQNYVKRLRHALGDTGHCRIRTQPCGYLISVDAGELDLTRFEALQAGAREAARTGSWERAAAQLRMALSLWRGAPLTDAPSDLLALREMPRLIEMRLQALEARIDADLHLGRHADVIVELRQLTAANPLRERLHTLLMLALHRCGQQAEALAAYQQVRRVLVDELGTEPSRDLRRLHQRILTNDPALDVPAAIPPARQPEPRGGAVMTRPPHVVPRQLPAAATIFAGRLGEMKALHRLLDQAAAGAGRTVVISLIGGTPGVGKTALAVHWAHQVAEQFPDGQLYIDLRGFDPSGTPVKPADAVRRFLDALEVPAERIPANTDAQQDLYRSLLAGKRLLIVLDNANDVAQVRPLLPGCPGSLVVVTSRCQLAGLAAAEGAHSLSLDVLSEQEARELLALRLGAQRLAGEPEAVGELTELCARLPLALAIVAARAAAHSSFPLAALVAELRDVSDRLDALDAGEAATSVRAVFSWSYRKLTGPAARMFRLLGVHPGPDITVPAAASLAGVPPEQARRALAELTRSHLLTEHVPGRFTFHDLLRAYAVEQARGSDSLAERHTAAHRLLDHYLHTCHAMCCVLDPAREPITLAPPKPGVRPEDPGGYGLAWAWCEAEVRVLLAAIALAVDAGSGGHAWQIPWALETFFFRRGRWHDLATTQRAALAAARCLGDTCGQAHAERAVGRTCALLGSYDEAHLHLSRALELFRDLGDRTGEARAHIDMGHAFGKQGCYRDALGHAQQARELYGAAGRRAGQAGALNNVGWYLVRLGEYEQALTCCQEALAMFRELGNRHGEATALDSVGYAHHMLGDHARGITCCRQALGVFRELGDRHNEAQILIHLGDTHHANRDPQAARDAWQRALAILGELNLPYAGQVRAALQGLAETPPGSSFRAEAGGNTVGMRAVW